MAILSLSLWCLVLAVVVPLFLGNGSGFIGAAAAAAASSPPPNLILVVADDLGHADVGWGNPRTITPTLDRLVKTGMELTQWYVFKYCAPTRGALMTGRYPSHFGFFTNQDANDYGVPTNFTMLPASLKKVGYRTHMIGKWHLGFRSRELVPTMRGFDTHLGYYHFGEDYYTHKQPVKGDGVCSGAFTDFSNSTGNDIRPLWGHGGPPAPSPPFESLTATAAGINAQQQELQKETETEKTAKETETKCHDIERNTCLHAYQNQITNFTTDSAEACCDACGTHPKCVQFVWYHADRKDEAKLCFLKSKASVTKNKPTQCDSGSARAPPPPPAPPAEENYSAMIFAKEAERIIRNHAREYAPKGVPMFLYLPFQSVHGPEEVPARFEALYATPGSPHYIADPARRTHQGMVTALDEAMTNVTEALKSNDMWNNTFLWFTSDNGGPLPNALNVPWRGGKFTNWEGGTRVRSFVHSPNPALLPVSRVGTKYDGMMHATDVYQTFMSLAGAPLLPDNGAYNNKNNNKNNAAVVATGGHSGPVPFDGFDMLHTLQTAGESPRTEVLYAPIVPILNPEDCSAWGQACGGALRMGRFKLIKGYPGDARVLPLPNYDKDVMSMDDDSYHGSSARVVSAAATADVDGGGGGVSVSVNNDAVIVGGDPGGGPGLDGCDYSTGKGCPCHHLNGGPCLFDVVADPSESHNLASDPAHAAVIKKMEARLAALSASHVPPAGLVGDALTADCVIKCNALNVTPAFEPYGKFIPWAINGTKTEI
eukprot:UC1_evm1s229